MDANQLLSFDYLTKKLENVPLQNKAVVLAELQQEAKKLGVSKLFASQIKLVEHNLVENKMAKMKGVILKDIPSAIKNTAGYVVTELGISLILPNSLQEVEICSKPIFITERYKDIEDGQEKVKIEYKSDSTWYSLIVPRSTIANSARITQLADFATGINSENAKEIVKYLNDIESNNRLTIPIKKSISKLGWTEYGFVPYVDDIVFSGADIYAELYSKFKEKGDFDLWKSISRQCLEYKIPKIFVSASYASLLLDFLGVNGFCVHLWGESGKGKTVAMMLSASIYGNPDSKKGIIRNGKSTENGIEPILSFFNNCACFFDELTTLPQEQINNMVYKFTQGQGKTRMSKNSTLQKTYTWNNVILLNAEKPLSDINTKSGAINRVISINTSDAIFGGMDMKNIADILRENYGFGAKRFIEAISNKENNIDFKAIFKKYMDKVPENIEQKQANAVCSMLVAYELACKYVYEIDDNLTIQDFIDFMITKEEVSASARAYNNLIDYISANYIYFNDSAINQSKWGKYTKNKDYVLIYPNRFREWCIKNSLNENEVLVGFKNRCLLKVTSPSKFQFKTTGCDDSKQDWFYAIKLNVEENKSNDSEDKSNDSENKDGLIQLNGITLNDIFPF